MFRAVTMERGFHSTKEGFKAGGHDQPPPEGGPVSIPLRKVSRQCRSRSIAMRNALFPFHQGRFQGCNGSIVFLLSIVVSIPPRKVSREMFIVLLSLVGVVSIPPRKVSR